MGDQGDTNIAVVALVISIIALIVTANQLLAQLLSSADGYRRCAESVIDSWHVKRNRIFKWSEFRFETQYVAPQIVLASPLEFEDLRENYEDVFYLNDAEIGENKECKELDKTVHQLYYQAQSHRAQKQDVERTSADAQVRRGSKIKRMRRTESDPLASWLRLLNELHQLGHSYWPDDCRLCLKSLDTPIWDKKETGVKERDRQTPVDSSNDFRTDIAIIYRTWTWDFMPSDMIRPVAEVSVSDIIILAIRMGMKWRSIDPDRGIMQADSKAYNLTGVEVRGLGTVLRFTASGTPDPYPRWIPSRAADKMLFGILPGDPELVRNDYPLIGRDRRVQHIAHPSGVLAAIDYPDKARHKLNDKPENEVRIDIITMLLAYLPLENSNMTRYCFPGWKWNPGLRSVHYFWEGRIALHRKLRERVDSGLLSDGLQDTLKAVLGQMDHLEQTHGDDWYCRWLWSPSIRGYRNDWETKQKCMADARSAWQYTQTYFISNGFHENTNTDVTKYVHLVAAHASMAYHACEMAEVSIKEQKYRNQEEVYNKFNLNNKKHGRYCVFELYELALHYVKHIHDKEHGINAYLRKKNIELADDEIEAAWWVLQLRAIVWHFSTWTESVHVREQLGDRIPSTFYGNKTPVWIT